MKNAKIINYTNAFGPSVIWAGIIFLLSDQEVLPGLNLSLGDFLLKKLGHIIVFGVLYILLLKGFLKIGKPAYQVWLQAMLICLVYATTDELHQAVVPGRTATIRDIGFDFIGISLAFLRKFKYI